MDEINRLDSELEAARKAVRSHLRTVAVAWYGDEPPKEGLDPRSEPGWFRRHDELREAFDMAVAAVTQADSEWVDRIRRG